MIRKNGLMYITRHGQTEWNTSRKTQGSLNIPLSETGRLQAEGLAERLEDCNIGMIFSSTLDRAYETAAIAGNRLGINVIRNDLLCEVGFGCWEGHTINEINELYPGQLENWKLDHDFHPENGESLHDIRSRVQRFISLIDRDALSRSNMLVVTHGLTGKVLLLELAGIPMDYLWSIRLDNTGISIIDTSGDRSIIVCLNDISHLENLKQL